MTARLCSLGRLNVVTTVLCLSCIVTLSLAPGVSGSPNVGVAPKMRLGCTAHGGCYDIQTGFNWYETQWHPEQTHSTENCGPASVLMAVQFAAGRDLPQHTVNEVRQRTGVCDGCLTGAADLEAALNYYKQLYGFQWRELHSMEEIDRAILDDHHVVIVGLWMKSILAGEDFQTVNVTGSQWRCPTWVTSQGGKCISYTPTKWGAVSITSIGTYTQEHSELVDSGRYNGYEGGHWVVAKGEIWRFGSRVVVYDPNVFSKSLYFWADGAPKGKDRVYTWDQFADAFAEMGQPAIEIIPAAGVSAGPRDLARDQATTDIEPRPGAVLPAMAGDSLTFLSHPNYGPGSVVSPGQLFVKTWEVRNTGSTDLGYEYALTQVSGPPMALFSETYLADTIPRGGTNYVSLYVNSPQVPGTYTAYWRMVDALGHPFGDLLPLDIAVAGSQTTCYDRAHFTHEESYIDDTDVDPGQAMDKWWRVQNTGTCTWSGYQLMFESSEQMNGSSPVSISYAAPGETVKIEVPMQAPLTPGLHTGYWRIVAPNGHWVEAGRLWIQVRVRGEYQSEGIQFVGAEYPDYVTPGQRFTPAVTIKVTEGRLLDKYSRGDLLRNVDGNTFGAWPHVELTRNVNTGEEYTFHFYENDPITAPDTPGTYESKWQVWQAGRYVGPVITIRFTVYIDNNHPNTPILLDPSNWWASGGTTNPPLLRAQEQGDPDGDPISHYYFEVTGPTNWNSGWIGSNQVTPGSLNPGNYQWRAKVRDSGGAESYFSETRNFTMDSQQLTIAPLEFVPGSPSDSEEVRVYTCVNGFGGIGLALKIEANSATDCSANGEWQWIHHLGAFCYNHSDPNTWPEWHTRAQPDGNHLVRATGFHNDDTIVTEACYQLNYRRPSDVIPVSPLEGTWWNTRQINFRWEPSLRTDNYRLLVSINPDPTQSPILDTNLTGDATEYTHTFDQDYETLYWKLVATNTKGSVEMGPRRFGIDRAVPGSSVAPLGPIQYEPNFSVSWQGTDDRSGIEWYDLQYRDGPRGEWTDWLTGVDLTVKMFNGQPGHTYCFRARALDTAGNLEAYPGGNGDTCAAVDVTAAPQTPWWNSSYASKRNIQILNNHTSTLLLGYPVHLHFDASTSPTAVELYASSTSTNKGDDVRVVYDNTTELNRWLQNFSASAIDIWFNTEVAIGGQADDQDSHQLYYGNPSATNPPDDIGAIFHQPVDANTVGLWRFFEGSGTTLHDETTYGNNGSFIGSPSWGLDGKFGPYLSFPKTNDVYVDCGNHSSLNVTSLTVEGWINFRESSQNYGIVRKAESQNEKFGSDDSWDMIRMNFYDQTGRGSWLLESSHFPMQQWHHFAFTYYQNTSTVRFYQDGSLTKTWVNPNGMSGPLNSNTAHLKIGGAPVYLQQIRVSNVARTDFSYGRYGQTTIEPSVAAGAAQAPPGSGSPDLVLQGLNAYPAGSGLEGGIIVQAVLSNEGDRATENGFFTDLYSDHLPTGAGDYSGSIHFWIDNPIQPGAVVTVTTLLTDVQPLLSATTLAGSITESSTTLYAQTDSSGSVTEPDDQNNITQGAEVCVASDDLYEPDNSPAEAQPILGPQTHNINTLTDEDWVTFWAEAGKTYVLATSNLGLGADTYLYLYDTDGATLLAANDDYGGTLASRIVWDCPATGTYYAALKHWNPNVSGCGTTYDLSFGEQHTLFLPLAFKRAQLGSANVAGAAPAPPTATPVPVELATPTPYLTPTATDTTTASPEPTITATVPVTNTATATSIPSPTEEQEPGPEPTSTPAATPTETEIPTPTEVPMPTTSEEEELPA